MSKLLCALRSHVLLTLVLLLSAFPALAAVKTVNGISVDVQLPQAQRGVPYGFQIAPTGGTGTYSFEITSGALPSGITMTPAGYVSGVNCVNANGTFPFDVRITSGATVADFAGGPSGFSINMTAGPGGACSLTIDVGALPSTGVVGTAYSGTAVATGGTAPYTWSLQFGSLPPGLSLSPATGDVSGTPTVAGTYSFTLAVSDSAGNTGFRDYTITVSAVAAAIAVSPSSLPDGTTAAAYSQTVTATGGSGTYTNFAVSAGSLPAGLSLDAATGAISGTPSTAGSYSFTVTVTDSVGNAGSQAYTVVITDVLALGPSSLPGGSFGAAYSQTLLLSGCTLTPSYAVSAGSLPAGLSLDAATGLISGTPSAPGSYSFTVTASCGTQSVSQAYTVEITAVSLAVSPSSLPDGTTAAAYSQTVTATGGSGTYTNFAVSAGSLPAGLSLDATTGLISGTPSTAGSYSFTVTVTDSVGNAGNQAYTVVITDVLALGPSSLPGGSFGAAYSQTLLLSGCTLTPSYAVSAGSLPAGLSLEAATGLISGTPSAPGSYSFTVTASCGTQSVSQAYTVDIAAVTLNVGPASLPSGAAGVPYSQTVTATGGSGTYTNFVVSAGSLPAGLSLDAATGAISGTPSTPGSYSFTVTVTDSAGNTGSKSYSVDVAGALAISPATLPDGTYGTAYSQTVTAAPCLAACAFSVTAGVLPAGLSLDAATGLISGTPSQVGSFSFTIGANDGTRTASQAYTVAVAGVPVAIGPAVPELPAVTAGSVYNQPLTATGGNGNYVSFVVTAGALPAGLALDPATGVLSGRPTASGTFQFTVQVTDTAGNVGTRTYSLTVDAVVIGIGPAALPQGMIGIPYSQVLVGSGGTAPYAWSLSSGALPAGVTLDRTTGALAGRPTVSGSFTFTVQATDANGNVGSRTYTLLIAARPDPTRDAQVIGLMDGQFASASRFGEGQINNVMRHVEGARGQFRCGLRTEVSVNNVAQDPTRRRSLDPQAAAGRSATLSQDGEDCKPEEQALGYWIAGSLEQGRDSGNDFGSDALTAGVDLRVGEKAMLGIALGYGYGDSQYGDLGTESDDKANSFMAYGSYRFGSLWFVDGLLGYGDVDLVSTRHVTADSSLVNGLRRGDLMFGSVSLGAQWQHGALETRGFLRYDHVQVELDAYREQGSSRFALGYDAASQDTALAVLGGRVAYAFEKDWGRVTPVLRLEYRQRFATDYSQGMRYLDLPDQTYTLRRSQGARSLMSGSLGLEVAAGALMLGVEYGTSALDGASFSGQSWRAQIRYGF